MNRKFVLYWTSIVCLHAIAACISAGLFHLPDRLVCVTDQENKPHCDYPLYDLAYRNFNGKPQIMDPDTFVQRDATYFEALHLLTSSTFGWVTWVNDTWTTYTPSIAFVLAIRSAVSQCDDRILFLQNAWILDPRLVIAIFMTCGFLLSIIAANHKDIMKCWLAFLGPLFFFVVSMFVLINAMHHVPHNGPTSDFVRCKTVSNDREPCVYESTFDYVRFVLSASDNFDTAQRLSDFGITRAVVFTTIGLSILVATTIVVMSWNLCHQDVIEIAPERVQRRIRGSSESSESSGTLGDQDIRLQTRSFLQLAELFVDAFSRQDQMRENAERVSRSDGV
jgi:hypothetical protein